MPRGKPHVVVASGTFTRRRDGRVAAVRITLNPNRTRGLEEWAETAERNGGRATKCDGALTITITYDKEKPDGTQA